MGGQNVKKPKQLQIKKVTLRNLDEPTLDRVTGGNLPATVVFTCEKYCTGPNYLNANQRL